MIDLRQTQTRICFGGLLGLNEDRGGDGIFALEFFEIRLVRCRCHLHCHESLPSTVVPPSM